MKNTLDNIAQAGMSGLAVAAMLAVNNKPNEPINPEIAYPLLFGGLALTTYFITIETYERFREASRTYNKR